jgi:hypothetical protein
MSNAHTGGKAMAKNKPAVRFQGKVIVEEHGAFEWFVMYPDGQIVTTGSRKAAEKLAKKWFQENSDETFVNVGQIEIRFKVVL